MSSYSRVIFFTLILSLSTIGCASQKDINSKDISSKEDLYIMLALDSEKNLDFKNSFKFYDKLYKLTSKKSYLKKAISYSYKSSSYEQMYTLSKKAVDIFPKEEEYFKHQQIIALHGQKKTDQALKDAKKIIKKYQTWQSYELIANIYYEIKDYKNSLKYYESAYAIKQNDKTLIRLTDILYSYLNQKDVALAYLETYIQTKKCNPKICNKLMLIYQEQGNIDGMLSILNRMYIKYKDKPNLSQTTLFIQRLIVSLLEKKDIKKAIKFLEESGIDQTKLINLYYQDRQLKKALRLTKRLYRKTKNPELLGKIAMYRFELAPNKKKVMKNVIANFELALSSGINNASYQNYYGYLLIDFDIDVEKGLKLVKQALKTAPNNMAYLDSLAWGYYKQNKCQKAYDIMAKIIQATGLKDPEIKLHFQKIEKCLKENKK